MAWCPVSLSIAASGAASAFSPLAKTHRLCPPLVVRRGLHGTLCWIHSSGLREAEIVKSPRAQNKEM